LKKKPEQIQSNLNTDIVQLKKDINNLLILFKSEIERIFASNGAESTLNLQEVIKDSHAVENIIAHRGTLREDLKTKEPKKLNS